LEIVDFPVTIGGSGAGIAVPGCAPGETLAQLGIQDGRLYFQRAGEPESAWLVPGMRVGVAQATLIMLPAVPPLIVVQHDLDNRTQPPDVPNPAKLGGDMQDSVPLARVAFKPTATAASPDSIKAPARGRRYGSAAALLLLLSLAVGVFVFGARAIGLRVITLPPDAEVLITGGRIHPRIAGRFWLTPGNYEVAATHAGFRPAKLPVKIDDASPADIRITLSPSPSPVLLSKLPPDAVVLWDDRRAASNPAVLDAGKHRLHIEAPRYAIYESTVEVAGGGRTQVVAPALVARWARVQISSEPSGATVRVDDQDRGLTPLILELDAGLRAIALSAAGAKDWHGNVLVRGGEAQTVGPVRLSAPDADLTVTSVPADADVTVAGQYRGRTPAHVRLAPGLIYEVTVQRAGFEAAARHVDLHSAPVARVDVRLVAQLGEVSVKGEPPDARVFVDGADMGLAGQTLKLPSASTRIEISKSGFDPYKTTLTPKPDYPQVLTYSLLAAGTSGKPVLQKVVKSSVGFELRLMPVGEFEMGSNRREPGRRSNEVQRRVALKRPFYLATTELTNGQFRRFKEAHSSGIYRSKTLDLDNQPVVDVTWDEAAEFCNWLSAQEKLEPAYVKSDDGWKLAGTVGNGYRLPTEAEWEFAARHDGTGPNMRYPWGSGLPIAPNSGNYADASAHLTLDSVIENYVDGYPLSTAPGKFPPSPLGLYDMGGNVSEWVNDYYTAAPPDSGALEVDPTGPAQGKEHVVRGSSYRSASITELRLAYREGAAEPRVDLGFRVARYAAQ
jgi:formylglycine-generating enzyme required for sulfatase activity